MGSEMCIRDSFRTFDLASPDSSSSGRFETTVPQQALFMVNSPFVQDLARNLERTIGVRNLKDPEEEIIALFQQVLQRHPSREELRFAREFLASQSGDEQSVNQGSDWQYGYGRVDSKIGRTTAFTPFDLFTKRSWRGGETLPDAILDWAHLTQNGGHPGTGKSLSVIRRWTAPYASEFNIEGKLKHSSDSGDGIRAFVVSSRDGVIDSWDLLDGAFDVNASGIELEAGDTLDFVVNARENVSHDSFDWRVKIRTPQSPLLSDRRYWDSREDFEGPQDPIPVLSPVARLSQVLLMSNELVFVD